MFYRFSGQRLVTKLVVIIAGSAAIGYALELFWPVLVLTLAVILTWHYLHLFRLIKWLWKKKLLTPPTGKGVWSHVYDGIYRKLRQYRQKQKELNGIIRRFLDGAEALPDAAVVLSLDYAIRWSNKKAARLLGVHWPGDAMQRIDNLLRSPEFSDYLTLADFQRPFTLDSPVNEQIKLELRFMAYGDEQLLMLARDVSQLNRLQEIRRDFVANVSHELKTPLTVVRGYMEMVQTSDFSQDPQWQHAFASIEGQVTRMDRLVEQLLVLSRVEIDGEQQGKVLINMQALISQLIDEAAWLNQEKQHKIIADIDESLGLWGIESEIKSACSNLLMNAIAYTQAQGEISIRWQRSAGQVCFSVKDNGPGIKAEHINRLTERFYRVDKSRSRNTGGSGLGLAIVKHVLQHHNGSLQINSRWRQGSEFSLQFPLSETQDS
jgi:two-component system phosphate regulon sensor histidine kinase PhoR